MANYGLLKNMFRLIKNIFIDNYNVVIGSVVAGMSTYFGKDFIQKKLENIVINTDKVKKIERGEEINLIKIGVDRVKEIPVSLETSDNFFVNFYEYLI